MISRVTDPANLQLVGIPPRDLLEEVEQAWRELGYDVHECWERAGSVTGEWQYQRGGASVQDRIVQKRLEERRIPLKHRTMQEVLDPMPRASEVIQKLLAWIDECDLASQEDKPRPAFREEIFDEELWWLTDLQKRPLPPEEPDEDGPASDEEPAALDAPQSDSDPMSGEDPDENRGEIPEGALAARQDLGRAVRLAFRTSRKRPAPE